MGAAGSYAALAGSTVTNTGLSTLNGDIGVYPGSAVSGFPPGVYTGGLYAGDVTAQTAIADLNIALLDAAARTSDADIAGDIGGLTLVPGVYTSATDLGLTGIVYLDCQNQVNASWIFQIGTLFYTNTGSQVVMLNVNPAMTAVHVWWACGSSATIGGGSSVQGVVMAAQSVSIDSSSTAGSLLAYIGGVTVLDSTLTSYGTVAAVVNGSYSPTISPTTAPTLSPAALSQLPTHLPTLLPSFLPTSTKPPSKSPTRVPTQIQAPSKQPTLAPSNEGDSSPPVTSMPSSAGSAGSQLGMTALAAVLFSGMISFLL
jgi:hypothetical protein